MAQQGNLLELDRCPHCNVDTPHIGQRNTFISQSHGGGNARSWVVYSCSRCGGAILTGRPSNHADITEMYPSGDEVDEVLPERARKFLSQALHTLHAPSGSVMLSASAVDAMLKEKEYLEGSLYSRIDKAVEDHLITEEMGRWAHDIRLDANDQRHADIESPLPTDQDARRCVDFALALGEFLFVLPAKVRQGLNQETG